MRIAFANDHAACELKNVLKEEAERLGHDVIDCGTNDTASVDYPDYAEKACKKVVAGDADLAVVICGTGIGMSLAANKIKGIRCCACSEPYSAAMSRRHNNANALALGARVLGDEYAKLILQAFLENDFEGGRHARRVDKIMALEAE